LNFFIRMSFEELSKTYQTLGNIEINRNNYEKSIEYFTISIKYNNNNYESYSQRSKSNLFLYNKMKAYDDSISSIKINKNYIEGYLRKSEAEISLERYNEAKDTLKQAENLEDMPRNEEIKQKQNKLDQYMTFIPKTNELLKKGNNTEAITELNKCIEIGFNQCELIRIRGGVYFQQGDYERAIMDGKESLKRNKKAFQTILLLIKAYYEVGDYESINEIIKEYEMEKEKKEETMDDDELKEINEMKEKIKKRKHYEDENETKGKIKK
jgi:tetratricopeptide (TPR) repeat protein